ncbi:MAG TPA: hypothetical protein DHS36_00570 [Candidatus Veblenbacteria bacterium]|uniref:Putative hydrolase (HAD superfamily) n=1 Tax=Candidatus Giovannonibacteria bacterium GW2011_GWF2_42_19 TaxID=1618659 RepID=A0A0G0ZDM2_9BACT|nr:MAG: putative hydrolase (HAD superfamily) [Candidatus Giovannonibacteria bacterium GW2011_GWF2_42_19]HCX38755.1 hypothetical protein [Candidatus Veblenbacteria bacterium]
MYTHQQSKNKHLKPTISVIVFDLDKTLYVNKKISQHIDLKIKKFIQGRVPEITDKKLQKLESEIPNVLDVIKYFGLDQRDFDNYVYRDTSYLNKLKPNENLVKMLASFNMKKYVVSLSPRLHINKVLDTLKIRQLFDGVFSVNEGFKNKEEVYQSIINETEIDPSQVCVVGDNYDIDLRPAKKLGMKTILINLKSMKQTYCIKSILELKYARL